MEEWKTDEDKVEEGLWLILAGRMVIAEQSGVLALIRLPLG